MILLFRRQYFYPVTIRIFDKIQAHFFVFKTDIPTFFVECTHSLIISGHTTAQMKFAFTKIICFGMIT